MPLDWQQLWQDFHLALAEPASEREAWLQAHFGSDGPRLRQLSELLASHARADHPLDQDWAGLLASVPLAPPPRAGDVLGNWRLLEPIGQGGMGQVWLAARCDGEYDKQAALKWIAAQAEGASSEAHFLRERQILARLEHPNIARLLDGGHDRCDRPYLVMEYVKGEPLTSWCDRRVCDWRQRLRLFGTVIDAVAYAHGQMIAHLDLKPGNVLVSAEAVPMLLDFGIARSLSGAAPGEDGGPTALTPSYASPEQLRGQPAGVASDVYALGLMLFELLTGDLPFRPAVDATTQRGQRLANTLPPRLGAVGRAPGCARRLPADLDWVIARALAWDPNRRYASVRELGDDLTAVLELRPVRARPQRLHYRAQRFLRRRWQWVAVASVFSLVALALVAHLLEQGERNAALLVSTRIDRERAEHTVAFLSKLFQHADRTVNGGQELLAREVLARGRAELAERQDLTASARVVLLNSLSTVYRNLGDYPAATELIENAVRLLPNLDSRSLEAETLENLGTLRALAGDARAAQVPLERALALRRAAADPAPVAIASAAERLAANLQTLGEHQAAGELFHEAWNLRLRWRPDDRVALAESALRLGSWHWLAGELDQAGKFYGDALAWRRAQRPADPAELARALDANGALAHARGDYPEALTHFEQALLLRRQVLGDRHRLTADTLSNIGACYYDQGQPEAAEAPLREALAIYAETLDANSPVLAKAVNNLGLVLLDRQDLAGARNQFERALAINRSAYGGQHARVASVQNNLALVAEAAGDLGEAETHLRAALAIDRQLLGDEHVQTAYPLNNLARVLLWRGRGNEALALFDRAYRIRSNRLPANHPALAETRRWQALALCRHGEAERGLSQIRAIRQQHPPSGQHPGPESFDARVIEQLCLIASSAGRDPPWSAAELADWRKQRGATHPLVGMLADTAVPGSSRPAASANQQNVDEGG
ncbi:MAG: tetratricopeptide repeat protein [Lysobacterales bacterium]